MVKNIKKSLPEIALLMMTRPARTECGRQVQAKVLAAVEADMVMIQRINAMIEESL